MANGCPYGFIMVAQILVGSDRTNSCSFCNLYLLIIILVLLIFFFVGITIVLLYSVRLYELGTRSTYEENCVNRALSGVGNGIRV